MARPKNPTFLGKRLAKTGHEKFSNKEAQVSFVGYEEDPEWAADLLDSTLDQLLRDATGGMDTVWSERSAQDALDKLEKRVLAGFKKLGARLGYDVED